MQKSDLVTTIETIGPATAKAYLAKMAANRKASPKIIRRYADAMRAGAWKLNHQGIAFDDQGRLCDGQHRLLAVVQSGATIKSQVSRYKTSAPMAILDSGRSRSPGDRIVLAGLVQSHGKDVASILNAMMYVESPHATRAFQPHEIEILIGADGEHVKWSMEVFQLGKKQWNSIIRGGFAYCRAFAREQVEELAGLVVDQAGYAEQSAAHTFVRALVDGRFTGNGGHGQRIDMMSRVLRCIQAHVDGERLPRLMTNLTPLAWASDEREARGLLMADQIRLDEQEPVCAH